MNVAVLLSHWIRSLSVIRNEPFLARYLVHLLEREPCTQQGSLQKHVPCAVTFLYHNHHNLNAEEVSDPRHSAQAASGVAAGPPSNDL